MASLKRAARVRYRVGLRGTGRIDVADPHHQWVGAEVAAEVDVPGPALLGDGSAGGVDAVDVAVRAVMSERAGPDDAVHLARMPVPTGAPTGGDGEFLGDEVLPVQRGLGQDPRLDPDAGCGG